LYISYKFKGNICYINFKFEVYLYINVKFQGVFASSVGDTNVNFEKKNKFNFFFQKKIKNKKKIYIYI